MLGLVECWEPHIFFHSRLHPSQCLLFFIWHRGKTQNPNISKNPNIRWSKKYRTSLSLLKTRKCSDAVLQMKIKTNDQIQVKYINYKKSAYYGKVI